MLALLQTYDYQEAHSVWEALRVWLNGEPVPGLRFTAGSSNAIMLVSALLFIFMLELLLTIGIQVWERRVLGRMQGRWGPQVHGNVNPRSFLAVSFAILLLLAMPALMYAGDYWFHRSDNAGGVLVVIWMTFALLGLLGILISYVAALVKGWKRHSRRIAVVGWSCLGIGGGLFVGMIKPGSIPVLTLVFTIAAFLIYIVYTLGWAWRQGLLDALKLFLKEDVVPQSADRFLFLFAPVMVYLPALLSWIVIPFGVMAINGRYVYLVVQDLNVGLLLIIADFAMFLVAIIMSGYGSNNKYALIGAMREAAMLLTYEIPMLMSLLCVALFAGSLNLTKIVEAQTTTWAILPLFPAFVIYLICALAETNRPPFDLAEASNELLGGYLVEYSGVRFSLFYVAEYANIFTASALMVVCFLGGWKGPMFLGFDGLWLTSLFWFLLKTYALVFGFIWARATMPRIRVDQIMYFSWKFLLPASVAVLAVTAMGVMFRHPWFIANRLPQLVPGPIAGQPLTQYTLMTTAQALHGLSLHERAFFWIYSALLAGIFTLCLWVAWRILRRRRTYPTPRREITWT